MISIFALLAVFQFCQDIQHFFAHGFAGDRLRFIGLRVWLFGVERYGQLRGKLISSFYGISDSINISVQQDRSMISRCCLHPGRRHRSPGRCLRPGSRSSTFGHSMV